MGLITANNVQFLNIRAGATPAAAATHGAAVDVVPPAIPQTPTAPALEPLPSMAMAALCFDNSSRSAIDDIACRAAEADGRTVYRIVAATLPVRGHVATCRQRTANASCSCQTKTDLRPLVQD